MDDEGTRRTLRGLEIAFAGRLASMTHAEAAAAARAAGARVVERVGADTDWVVVGEGGPPLGDDGRLTKKLARALELADVTDRPRLVREDAFLRSVGLWDAEEPRGLYTPAQIARLVGVPLTEIRRYVRLGLVRPHRSVRGVHRFSFREVAWVRRLVELLRGGARPASVRASLDRLRGLFQGEDLDRVRVLLDRIERSDLVLVRLPDGRLAEPSGQLRLDFDGDAAGGRVVPLGARARRDSFEAGLEAEIDGRLEEAASIYERLLRTGPVRAEIAQHLGGVLLALERPAEAARWLRLACDLDPTVADNFVDLGDALARASLLSDAVEAYLRALVVDPEHAEAHFGLGEAFAELGDLERARHHWLRYVERSPRGPAAERVRRRLRHIEEEIEPSPPEE